LSPSPTLLSTHPPTEFEAILQEYPAIVRLCTTEQPVKHNVTHYIHRAGSPVHAHPRRLSPEHLKSAKDHFEYILQQGIIRPSSSCWVSPLHMVPKKTGDWQPCRDYQSLHHLTDILSLIYMISPVLCKEQLYSLDWSWLEPIAKIQLSIPKTAITTPLGLIELLRMPFGGTNLSKIYI